MQRTISIIGRSGSGKTTLIEKLIVYFKNKGYKISIIKHMRHDFNMDLPGKDTFRYKSAGSHASVITNDRMLGIISNIDEEMTPEEIARKFLYDSDIVIIEGYKEGDLPKIEVIGENSDSPLFKDGVPNLKAVVCDSNTGSGLPSFKRDDAAAVANFIEEMIFSS